MTIPEIFSTLQEKFPNAGLVLEEIHPDPVIRLKSESLVEVSQFLRDDSSCLFNSLMCLTGLESDEELQVVYNLYSTEHNHKVNLRCGGTKDAEVRIPTLSHIWRTAEWHEREAYDLLGMMFENHPDPRRILLPDDWVGHPLRKDYEPQEKWHAMPLTEGKPLPKVKKR